MARNSLQIPLPLPHAPEYGRASFLPGSSNRAALALLERWPDWPARVVVLSGPKGSGKTHLAHIWSERSGADLIQATALDLERQVPVRQAGALAVEDMTPGRVPEEPLFHLFNSVAEAGASLLITSRAPASDWRIEVADLRSRLRMAAPAALGAPSDDLLRQVLVKLFADRQLAIDRAVIDFLLLRMERSFTAAVSLVDALDREGLATAQRITRPLAARILSEKQGSEEEFTERE